MLSRFTNASAISSADFYGEGSNSGGGRALTDLDFTASELIGKISVQVLVFLIVPVKQTIMSICQG